MIKKIFNSENSILGRRQSSILSAATVVMVMIAASRLLGLVRNRVLVHFFSPEVLSPYLAAFRLPDTIFEILVYGALSSAFIPVFTSYFAKDKRQDAWYVASVSLNIGLICFFVLATIIFIFAQPIYSVIAPGFTPDEINKVGSLTRFLIVAQGFFVASYFMTGVLESMQRFLVPAIAPLFYNLGIILTTVIFAGSLGIYAPAIGAVVGACLHFLIQLPVAHSLGFRWQPKLDFRHPGVRSIGKLALPRLIELSILQIGKFAELFLASLVSTASYTYFTFANSFQLLPIGLFGTSLAKASLPVLAAQHAQEQQREFVDTVQTLFGQILFLVVPCSVFLVILRVPMIRLVFGAEQFDWEATVQTGYALSAFALGIFSQALTYLLTRAFYALQDTVTPVKISIAAIFLEIIFGAIFIIGLHLPIWSLALAFSLSSIIQCIFLLLSLAKKISDFSLPQLFFAFGKICLASGLAGSLMFFLLKIMDKSVYADKLAFLEKLGLIIPTDFEVFVLDTRYTLNLLMLTVFVASIGLLFYLLLSKLFRIEEREILTKMVLKITSFKIPKSKVQQESLTIDQE